MTLQSRKESQRGRFDFVLIPFLLCLSVLACNLPRAGSVPEESPGLQLEARAADGTVSGSYRPNDPHHQKIRFSVSADGVAAFHVEGAADAEKLTVLLGDEQTARMTWSGVTLDGMGVLDEAEQAAIAGLSSSDLLHGIALIPLDIACLGEEQIDPQQVAALLFPLQMHFKYQIADRNAAALELMALSECGYAEQSEAPAAQRSQIYLTAANPIPVVLGYFPFDAEGAIENPSTGLSGRGLACLAPPPGASFGPASALDAHSYWGLEGAAQTIRDQFGPCEAKCRGACGPDCTLNNCTLTADYRCEVDENGNNTGKISYVHIYDCGLHPACVQHDQCYDDCNRQFGCGTFRAAHCRHGGWTFTENIPDDYYCDLHTVLGEDRGDVMGWVDGFGPQPLRQVFVYTDKNLRDLDDLENCPLPAEPTPVEPGATEPPAVVSTEVPVLVYEGFVTKAEGAFLDLQASYVVIEVAGEQVTATIDFTFSADMKWQNDEAVCTATMIRVYSGQALLDIPLEISLALVSYDDTLQGSDCTDVVVPVIKTQLLTGAFDADGSFSGNIRNVWLIDAVRVDD